MATAMHPHSEARSSSRYLLTPISFALMGVVLGCFSPLAAAESAELDLSTRRIESGSGGWLPLGGLDEAVDGVLGGGVRFSLSGLELLGEEVHFTVASMLGAAVVSKADVAAADGGRIVLDTTGADLPSLGFRGRLEPQQLQLETIALEDAEDELQLRLRFTDLGEASGELRAQDGSWQPFTAEAETLAVMLRMPVRAGRLQTPRLERIELLAAANDVVAIELRQVDQDLRVRSRTLTFTFADDGSLNGMQTGPDCVIEGFPRSPAVNAPEASLSLPPASAP